MILSPKIILHILVWCHFTKWTQLVNKNGDYIYIICGLIDGFIEIYNHIPNKEFKLSLSFKAHRDLISKIIQLRNSGLLLTGSFDNSFKIFKLTCNCTQETLIYTIYLNFISF